MTNASQHPERVMNRFVTPALVVATITAFASADGQASKKFTLTSTDVHQGQKIANQFAFNGMGCTGSNLSPALSWSGAPAKTKSYAVTMYDPDAPTGSGWWHWVAYNIPASVTKLDAGAGDASKHLMPAGAVQGNNDAGTPGYMGPCPPAGDKAHHYQITVFALDTDKIDVPANATAAYVGFNLHAHTLAKAEITAVYNR